MRRILLTFVVLFMCLLPALGAGGQVGVYSKTVTEGGKSLVVIGNSYIELTFEPARGGRCVSFRFLDNGEQIVNKEPYAGMFLDHWAKYPWPSGLMHLPYEFKIVGDGKTRVGVKLWVTVPAKGGGAGTDNKNVSMEMPTSPELIGLVVSKTIWLNGSNDLVNVDQEVTNPTSESRGVALFLQHNFNMNGSRAYDTWYLPSTNGVAMHLQPDDISTGRPTGVDWVQNPTAGWIAVRDRQTNRGMLFAFDYNYLQKTYTCGSTAEWHLETVPLAPGKTFKTQYVIKPESGFQDFVYGSKNIVADIRPHEAGEEVRVEHDIAAVSGEPANVDVSFTVLGWKSKEVLAKQEFRIAKLGYKIARQDFTFVPKDLSDGVVIQAVVKGVGFEERYEYYYAGDKVEEQRKHNNFAVHSGDTVAPLPGTQGDAYLQKQPHKVKNYDKPDFSKIPGPTKDHFKVMVVFGLYTNVLGIDDALDGWTHGGKSIEFNWVNCPPNGIESLFGSYDELFAYNTIALCDVNYKAMGDTGFEMLCDYVQQGGNLLVTGGPYAFGNGEFEGSRFLDVLPVTVSSPFDLKWAGKGASWNLTPALPSHAVLQGVSFAERPKVFWNHLVAPKPKTAVILKAGSHPALVLGHYGKGRVAVFTLSPTGDPQNGETAWWDWQGWFPLVKNVFTWLNR